MTEVLSLVSTVGFDLALVLFIVFATYVVRLLIKPTWKWIPIVPVFVGIVVGILQIVFAKTPVAQWPRIVLGYPAVGMAAYMLYRKYLPDSTFLKPKDKESEDTSISPEN